MKKVISILAILMVIACAAFAATGDLLNINAKVPATDPIYSLKGGLSDSTGKVATGTAANGTITTDVDISTTDIYIYVQVFQTNKSKTLKSGSLTLEGTALEYLTSSTAAPAASNATAGSTDKATNHYKVTAAVSGATATFAVEYDGKNVAENSVIGSALFKWTHNDELEVADGVENFYTATITLTYTVQ
ncbi:MAG: hypothetical protein MJ057_01250 [Sphaerochaetaceae bacterium]|nr:hypothetical protein [Sphaerochaetaceae bacterium]